MRRFRLPALATLLTGVACAALAPLAVHWAAGRTLAAFDTAGLYAPERWLVDDALRALRLPLWNPFLATGQPLHADAIHGALHPVSVLFAWLGGGAAVDLLLGAHLACAAAGAALLAHDLGASRAGAAAAGFAYALSGFVLSMTGNLVFLAGAGSLPFCLAGARRVAAGPRPAHLALGVLGPALLALTGEAQGLMVGGALGLALAAEAGGWRGAARAAAAGALGLLVAGAQLVPSAWNLPRTIRGDGTWSPEPLAWALAPWRLLELALPGLVRGPSPFSDPVFAALAGPGRWPSWSAPHPFAPSLAVGLLTLGLAAAGAWTGRTGRWLALLGLGLAWLALGPTLGADAALGWLPVWGAFRYAEKLVGPLSLVLAVLAGLGLDALAEGRVPARRFVAAVAAAGLAAAGAGHLAALASPAVATTVDERVLRGAWHAAGAVGALGAWALARRRLGLPASRAALAALVWLAMAGAAPLALWPGDPAARLAPPLPAFAAEPPGPRLVTPFPSSPLADEAGVDRFDQASRWEAARGQPAYPARGRLDTVSEYAAMIPRRLSLLHRAFGPRFAHVARRFGVTHLVADPPMSQANLDAYAFATHGASPLPGAPPPAQAFAVPHRPWASFAPAVRPAGDDRAALAALVDEVARQGEGVVVEGRGAFGTAPGRVLGVARGLESIRVEAEAAGPATLVVCDAYWPGWEATIDGAPATIFAADVLVRAVRWPAGRHVLEMRYRPPEADAGLLASGLGLALLAGWLLLERGRDRAAAPARPLPPG